MLHIGATRAFFQQLHDLRADPVASFTRQNRNSPQRARAIGCNEQATGGNRYVIVISQHMDGGGVSLIIFQRGGNALFLDKDLAPDLLGGAKTFMIGSLIEEQFKGTQGNWPFGSAVAMILMSLVLVVLMFYARAQSKGPRV